MGHACFRERNARLWQRTAETLANSQFWEPRPKSRFFVCCQLVSQCLILCLFRVVASRSLFLSSLFFSTTTGGHIFIKFFVFDTLFVRPRFYLSFVFFSKRLLVIGFSAFKLLSRMASDCRNLPLGAVSTRSALFEKYGLSSNARFLTFHIKILILLFTPSNIFSISSEIVVLWREANLI